MLTQMLPQRKAAPTHNRRGSALLIVMVLMAMLSLLGVLFYLFATQERLSAEYYSNAAKVEEYDFTIDQQFDFALEQIIVGPKLGQYKNSALYGGRHSIIPNMLGSDLHPFNGQGVDPRNPTPYDEFNDSPSANSGREPDLSNYPQPDVDYTYPDINNVFLSYDGPDREGRHVIIPSFHRPQYGNLASTPDWYQSPGVARRVMRPNEGHVYVPPAGRRLNTTVPRFRPSAGTLPFPFAPNDDPDGNTQIGEQGVWSNSFVTLTDGTIKWIYEYDVDNDLDNIREGIWLDLDFPALEDESGQLYIPLVSATIKDADALLNLNVHGNLARVWDGSVPMDAEFAYTSGAGQDRYVSRSNLGLTPAEVNPLWALNRQPGIEGAYTAEDFFSNTPPNLQFESANREWLFMMMGRFNQTTTDLVPGRFGEVEKMYQNVLNSTSRTAAFYNPWPGPGQTDVDDNSDAQQVSGGFYGQGFIPFGRPMDYAGLGSFTTFGKYALVGSATPTNLARWPRFNGYSTLASVQPVWSTFNNGMTASVSETLSNDMMETVFDLRRASPSDDLFGPDEMRLLHLSNADFNRATGGNSRLSRLAPFNFDTSVSTFPVTGGLYQGSRSAQRHRGKFTTLSWDRKQFNPPPYVDVSSDPYTRSLWEYNADADRDGHLEFPTAYDNRVYSSGNGGSGSPVDPFRPLLRKLIEVEPGDRQDTRLQFRLSLNELLTNVNGDPLPNFNPGQIPPELVVASRPLTNHNTAAVDGSAMGGPYAYPSNGAFSTAKAQEWWARRDRQLMARDLYVLMYTMCFGHDETSGMPLNPTGNSSLGGQLLDLTDGSEDRILMRRMAQFAVNVVDSLDRDSIFTKFEYDINLSNGWNVDDDPFTDSGESDREVVWGVERLDLTISETLLVRAGALTNDENRTQWTDDEGDFYFSYVELRNPGPRNVDLDTEGWRIQVATTLQETGGMSDPVGDAITREFQLLDQTINAGDLYTIASIGIPAGGTPIGGNHPSVLKVADGSTPPSDWDNTPSAWIAPANGLAPNVEMELPAHSSRYSPSGTPMVDATNAPTMHDFGSGSVGSTPSIRFRLQRLVYPDLPEDATHNPWVTVDSQRPELHVKSFSSGSIDTVLTEIKSTERDQPFDNLDKEFNNPGATRVQNTLAADNYGSPAAFNRFQAVLDRDYASIIELFQIGIGGGDSAVKGLRAESYFLSPLRQSVINPDDVLPNRWHRLLEFVEVPTRTHRGIPGFANAFDYPRVPGKININMIRHPEVLAALVDDPTVMRLLFMDDYNQNGSLDGIGGAATAPNLPDPPFNEDLDGNGNIDIHAVPPLLRTDTYYDMNGTPNPGWTPGSENWWSRFLQARDGRRISALNSPSEADATFNNYFLPGTTYSTPFRSWGHLDNYGAVTAPAVETTLLRSWPADTGAEKRETRHLFELGTLTDHRNEYNDPDNMVDPTVRNRILAKIANNVTTRSNVFVIYLSLKYFKAVENNGAIQIGEPLDTSVPVSTPDHRGFFVIDRTRAEDAWDPATQRFDFRSVIQFRQVLQ